MNVSTGRYRIGKSFAFDAAHRLAGLPEGHKCGRLHGHTYTVEIVVTACGVTAPGFVTDFGNLAPVKKYLDEHLDHRSLNDVLPCEPTSENLARFLAEWFVETVEPTIDGRLEKVRVSETPSSWAEFEVTRP
ncbi:6-pyruvoyl trahydropterin synthase family protein [Streptomyces sp. G7(2002)]|uniref:6-pyruvoyl trahydropterin synthase family protein n=1 Tax=Streptomyces sp. G7(2002) TaxID=2971798 RepID=UPI00237E5A29|nr:6-carboxytetrahydropterin synthase [Streptomyces sp. G7(2002)]WDT53520.1 6-carboxytetrahydropterin synthase [Streptomyces sp. G7(2002)]